MSTAPFAQSAITIMTAIAAGSLGFACSKLGDGDYIMAAMSVMVVTFVAAFLAYYAAGGES